MTEQEIDMTKKLTAFLKDFFKNKDHDKYEILGMVLLCKEAWQADALMQYCKENPEAETDDVLMKAIDLDGGPCEVVISNN